MTQPDITELNDLYKDPEQCAKLIGLAYIDQEAIGFTRVKSGKGFAYRDINGKTIIDQKLKESITSLVIPPAWQQVWICPNGKGHVLATGIDEKGRKQYIYHPKWRTMRDLIKFYRLLVFAAALPKIRAVISKNLDRTDLDRDKVLAVMLWLLDNTYLRVGNDVYFHENDSVGLSTLTDKNIIVAGNVLRLFFKAKSGKHQQLAFEDARIARAIKELTKQRGRRLFRYKEDGTYHEIIASDVNEYLQEITSLPITAKDFRTWGGTLMAFNHLVATYRLPEAKTPKPEKVAVEAVDAAANVLGNTRSVAKSSYIHPDLLTAYSKENFGEYYERVKMTHPKKGLDKRETELVSILTLLFEKEFTLLTAQT